MPFKTIALVLIDIQKGLDEWDFYGGNRNNLEAEKNASKLLDHFRAKGLPVFHVQHSSQNPNSPLHASKQGFELKDEVKAFENEPVFTKTVNSAFIGTDLEQVLKIKKIESLVIAGLTSQHCVSTSVRMASNLGFCVFLAEDACAAFSEVGIDGEQLPAELVHQVTMANLKDEFAKISKTLAILDLIP